MTDEMKAELFQERFRRLQREVGKVIVGQDRAVEDVLIALAAHGHVLLEGVPGLGKTLLVRSIAQALELDFSRVQFTPDLMPADIIGTHFLIDDQKGGRSLEFRPGPVFTQVLLADEINRATPKTQSALLEAMGEGSVTTGGVQHQLPAPFFVLATQNPLEMEGTYPLPEAQLDRFFSKVVVPFPTLDELGEIIDRTTGTQTAQAEPVLDAADLLDMQRTVRRVLLAEPVKRYALSIVLGTHPTGPMSTPAAARWLRYGASPRGAQAIILGARVRALLAGRPQVAFEDVKASAMPALRHRLLLNFEAEGEGLTADDLVDRVLSEVPQPIGAAA
jgi:MoxR-like ATPase